MDDLAAFTDYVRRSPRRYASATIQKRVAMVRRYLDSVSDPYVVNVFDIERWAGQLELGASATRDAVSHVRAFYRWAIRTGVTNVDPTAAVSLPTAPRRLPRPARDNAIAGAVLSAEPAIRAMLALMAGAGLRCCEVARLRWSDVDLLAGTVYVTGKGGRDRMLEISAPIRRALAAIDHPGVYVFGPYTPCRVSQLVNEHLRPWGCTAHQLRHRFATRTLAECGNLSIVRDLLGHASIQNTEIYAAVTPGAAGVVSRSIDVPGLG